MRVSARTLAVAGAVGLALFLSACGDDAGTSADTDGDGNPQGTLTIGGCNPQNPLVPASTNEVCGGNPLDAVFSMLVKYDPETGESQNEIAESIQTDDNQRWTITIRDGWTFHDGTPITAASFVDAWNWAAHGANATTNAYFFSPIEGYAESQGETDDDGNYIEGSGSDTLSGLQLVDDRTFIVELSQPEAGFPQRLGYLAFAPMPESFYSDVEAFGQQPIGSGPFQLIAWNQGASIQLAAYDGYQGDVKPRVENITFRIYQQQEAEYADLLADNVDLMTRLPGSALTGETYKADLGSRYIEREAGTINIIGFPSENADPTMSNVQLRRAISMSIDRQLIIDNIFQGVRQAATGWVSPVVDGYLPDQCGEFCEYNPERARDLLAESGYSGSLTLTYNADGDHQAWTAAACNSISNALEIECTPQAVPLNSEFLGTLFADEMEGMFRLGWQMDYPSIENFLVPMYATGASANLFGYSNDEFDDLLARAAQAPEEEAISLYQQAERLLVDDMPSIPLWYDKIVSGYSSRVNGDSVRLTPFGTIDLLSVSLR